MATQKARVGRIYLKGTNTLRSTRSSRNSPYAETGYQNVNMATAGTTRRLIYKLFLTSYIYFKKYKF